MPQEYDLQQRRKRNQKYDGNKISPKIKKEIPKSAVTSVSTETSHRDTETELSAGFTSEAASHDSDSDISSSSIVSIIDSLIKKFHYKLKTFIVMTIFFGNTIAKVCYDTIVPDTTEETGDVESIKETDEQRQQQPDGSWYIMEGCHHQTRSELIPISKMQSKCKWLDLNNLNGSDRKRWEMLELILRSGTHLQFNPATSTWETMPGFDKTIKTKLTGYAKTQMCHIKLAFTSSMVNSFARDGISEMIRVILDLLGKEEALFLMTCGTCPSDPNGFKLFKVEHPPKLLEDKLMTVKSKLSRRSASDRKNSLTKLSSCSTSTSALNSMVSPPGKSTYMVHSDINVVKISSQQIHHNLSIELKSYFEFTDSDELQIQKQLLGGLYDNTEVFGLLINAAKARIYRMTKSDESKTIKCNYLEYKFARPDADSLFKFTFDSDELIQLCKDLLVVMEYRFQQAS